MPTRMTCLTLNRQHGWRVTVETDISQIFPQNREP